MGVSVHWHRERVSHDIPASVCLQGGGREMTSLGTANVSDCGMTVLSEGVTTRST